MRLLGLLCILLLLLPTALAFQSQDWQYVQDIGVPAVAEPVKVTLDPSVLAHAQLDGRDFRVTRNDEELPYKLSLEGSDEIERTIQGVTASSARPDFRSVSYAPSTLIDGDASAGDGAYYEVDATKDLSTAWIIADLGSPLLSTRAQFTMLDMAARYTHIQVEGSDDGNTWTLLKAMSKTSQSSISYAPSTFRYLRFTFRHDGALRINELAIFGESSGWLLFMGATTGEFRLYYGHSGAATPDYSLEGLYTTATTPAAYLLGERVNPAYDADADGDGVTSDNCPSIENPGQADSDNDGVGDACDNCVDTSNKGQQDWDHDGFGDSCDNCPRTYNPNQYDDDFDGTGWQCDDQDGDGVLNPQDNCVDGRNADQQDVDRDGIGDACEDDDGDGIANYADNCPGIANADQADSEATKDGVGDACDNCIDASNRDQRDTDDDGVGDACEDGDDDGIYDTRDNCEDVANADQVDWDGDGLGDACDNCPEHKNKDQRDVDKDGLGDACDGEESRILEQKGVIWTIIIVAVLVLGFLAYRLYQEPEKK